MSFVKNLVRVIMRGSSHLRPMIFIMDEHAYRCLYSGIKFRRYCSADFHFVQLRAFKLSVIIDVATVFENEGLT